MQANLAELIIAVKTKGARKATAELDHLYDKGVKAERGIGKLSKTLTRFASVAVIGTGAVAGFRKAFAGAREFQDWQAQLKTAMGTLEGATDAFKAIEQFATTTPYTLDQSVDAFIKLKNLGIAPTQERLKSFGNTASAMGKDMMQMIEAVADASTFEFERLKEFGIKARQQKDSVRFTFQGVTTEVKKDSEEIVKYLESIGNVNFAGAMDEKMKTLGGAMSNLEDSWDHLWRVMINEEGQGAIYQVLKNITGLIDDMSTAIESGAVATELESWAIGWDNFAKTFSSSSSSILNDLTETTGGFVDFGEIMSKWLTGFKQIPSLVALVGKVLGNVAFGIINSIKTIFTSFGKAVMEYINTVIEAIKQAGKGIGLMLKGEFEEGVETFSNLKLLPDFKDNWKDFKFELGTGVETALEGINKAGEDYIKTFEEIRRLEDESRKRYEDYQANKPNMSEGAIQRTEERLKQAQDEIKRKQELAKQGQDEELAIARQGEAKKTAIARKGAEDRKAVLLKQNSERLTIVKSGLSNAVDIARAFGKKGFEVSKGLAIANATVSMYESAVNAMATKPFIPAGLLAMGGALARGATMIANITSTGYYARGGIVGGTSYTGDKVPAMVNSGEMILNKAQQATLFKIANDGARTTAGKVEVNVYNNAPNIDVETREENDGSISVIIAKAVEATRQTIIGELHTGVGEIPETMENVYALGRGNI